MSEELSEREKTFLKEAAQRAATRIRVVSVKPGDVLHIQLGLTAEEMGSGGPWIPGPEELEYVTDELKEILPLGVRTWVTHLGIKIDAVVQDWDD
jgi:hypothetical protein